MLIAIGQNAGRAGDVARNLALMRQTARKAAGRGAGLLIMPEMFLTGYHIGERVGQLAEPADGPSAEAAAAIARQAGIAILYGYPERSQGAVYNAARLVDKQGRPLANCRKTHLYGPQEKRHFRPGGALTAVSLGGLNVGLLICYDVEFPEAVRALALAGAELVAVPTALMKPYCRIIDTVIPTRAYENQLYVAYANRCGREGDLHYCGRSTVAAPDGTVLAQAPAGEALLLAEIDPERVAAERRENPVLADLRPALYRRPVAR